MLFCLYNVTIENVSYLPKCQHKRNTGAIENKNEPEFVKCFRFEQLQRSQHSFTSTFRPAIYQQ